MNISNYNEELEKPKKPKELRGTGKPERQDFKNNAKWGIALDKWDEKITSIKEKFDKELEVYHAKTVEREKQFWLDLEDDLTWNELSTGLKSVLREMAWEEGHSYGYVEVYNYACSYSEIVQAIQNDYQLREK